MDWMKKFPSTETELNFVIGTMENAARFMRQKAKDRDDHEALMTIGLLDICIELAKVGAEKLLLDQKNV